jgi:hypothetical protein
MACPFFYPVERFQEREWATPPRLPLGDPYHGMCLVNPTRERRPDLEIERQYCNLGYARGKCPRFPADAEADSVRFMVAADTESVLRLEYVVERNHAPLEHSSLECSLKQERWVVGHSNDVLRRQAQAYLESYLLRKREPQLRARHPHRR